MSEILNTPKKSYGEFKGQKKRSFTPSMGNVKIEQLIQTIDNLNKRIDVLERRINAFERERQ